MGKWHQTGCVLCAQNCGLEIQVENNRMVNVRPAKQTREAWATPAEKD